VPDPVADFPIFRRHQHWVKYRPTQMASIRSHRRAAQRRPFSQKAQRPQRNRFLLSGSFSSSMEPNIRILFCEDSCLPIAVVHCRSLPFVVVRYPTSRLRHGSTASASGYLRSAVSAALCANRLFGSLHPRSRELMFKGLQDFASTTRLLRFLCLLLFKLNLRGRPLRRTNRVSRILARIS
jgi:hypothetical protein